MGFKRGDIAAARTFVDSVYAAGGARVGKGARHPGTWSDTYTLRVANVWQRQAAAGRPLSLQEARRGQGFAQRVYREQAEAQARGKTVRGGLEHPRQRFVGPTVKRRGREVPDLGGSAGFYARQYRRPSAAGRFIENLGSERVQVIGYGVPVTGYVSGGDDDAAIVSNIWRVLFTGPREVAIDAWDLISSGYHVSEDGADAVPVFDVVERLEIRWGPGIGD